MITLDSFTISMLQVYLHEVELWAHLQSAPFLETGADGNLPLHAVAFLPPIVWLLRRLAQGTEIRARKEVKSLKKLHLAAIACIS